MDPAFHTHFHKLNTIPDFGHLTCAFFPTQVFDEFLLADEVLAHEVLGQHHRPVHDVRQLALEELHRLRTERGGGRRVRKADNSRRYRVTEHLHDLRFVGINLGRSSNNRAGSKSSKSNSIGPPAGIGRTFHKFLNNSLQGILSHPVTGCVRLHTGLSKKSRLGCANSPLA